MTEDGPEQRRTIKLPGNNTVTAGMLRRLLEDPHDVPDEARVQATASISEPATVTLWWDESL